MSCGSKVCTSIEFPRHIETAKQSWSLLRVWRAIETVIHKARLHQIQIELEKARQRGLLKHVDDQVLEELGLARELRDRDKRNPI